MKQFSEVTKIVRLALIKVGIKCDYYGFDYLADAIEIIIENPTKIYTAKKLLAELAERRNEPNVAKIESNIQNAICNTYDNRGFNSINELYGMQVIRPDHKPNFYELSRLIADYYLMDIYLDV